MGKILFKIHKSSRWVVAVCDKDVYGRKLVEGKRQLDLSGDFFNGEEFDEGRIKEKIIDCAKEDATFNIVGADSVRVAKEIGLVVDDGVVEIEGVPFALVLL